METAATPQRRIAIVGDGIAGFRLADLLSQTENPAHITLFGRDPVPACNRPLLSKSYLLGSTHRADLSVPRKNADGYTVCQHSVRKIDLEHGSLITTAGNSHAFDDVVIATGLQPRHLPHIPESAQITLTTADAADTLMNAMRACRPIRVVGGGMLALEAASSLNAKGAHARLVTRSALPLQRTIGAAIATRIAQRIRDSGLDWQISSQTDAPETTTELTVAAVGGDFDATIFAPPYEHFASSRGVLVNSHFQSVAHPHLWAIGDAAIWPDGNTHPQWFSALESARRAAAGLNSSVPEQGWRDFVHSSWSDQWGIRIQTFGLPADSTGLTEKILLDAEDEIMVGFVDAAGTIHGIAALSPQGKPSPALQARARIGHAAL